MQIQINASHVQVRDDFKEFVETRTREVLAPFEGWLTRVEIHLKDDNGRKGGLDKRCVLEARPRGLDPIAVEAQGKEVREAFTSGLSKLQHALQHRFGKLSSRRSPSAPLEE